MYYVYALGLIRLIRIHVYLDIDVYLSHPTMNYRDELFSLLYKQTRVAKQY